MTTARQTQILEAENERVTKAKRAIDTDHAYIHEGIFFESFLYFTLNASASKVISFKTPATGYIHYRNEKISCSADKLLVTIKEGATLEAETGTAITPYNHNRVSTITAQSVLLDAPTVTEAGTTITQFFLGGGTGTGSNRSGSETQASNEWVLKQDTVYTITITNNSTASNIVNINQNWYEETST